MKILFVEPPKDYWFVMGEYLPPPYGILQLAAFLENKHKDAVKRSGFCAICRRAGGEYSGKAVKKGCSIQ